MTWSTNNKQHTTTTMFGGNSAHVSTGEEKQNTTHQPLKQPVAILLLVTNKKIYNTIHCQL
jgi:hypothetical protein